MNDEILKHFSFRVRWNEEENKWMGQCPSFGALYSLSDSLDGAFAGIVEKVRAHVTSSDRGIHPEKSVFQSMDETLMGAPGPFGKS